MKIHYFKHGVKQFSNEPYHNDVNHEVKGHDLMTMHCGAVHQPKFDGNLLYTSDETKVTCKACIKTNAYLKASGLTRIKNIKKTIVSVESLKETIWRSGYDYKYRVTILSLAESRGKCTKESHKAVLRRIVKDMDTIGNPITIIENLLDYINN